MIGVHSTEVGTRLAQVVYMLLVTRYSRYTHWISGWNLLVLIYHLSHAKDFTLFTNIKGRVQCKIIFYTEIVQCYGIWALGFVYCFCLKTAAVAVFSWGDT